jgi:hypothetical protein
MEVDGKKLWWERTSRRLAEQMAVFSVGDALLIRRSGQKNQTRYEIVKLNM